MGGLGTLGDCLFLGFCIYRMYFSMDFQCCFKKGMIFTRFCWVIGYTSGRTKRTFLQGSSPRAPPRIFFEKVYDLGVFLGVY